MAKKISKKQTKEKKEAPSFSRIIFYSILVIFLITYLIVSVYTIYTQSTYNDMLLRFLPLSIGFMMVLAIFHALHDRIYKKKKVTLVFIALLLSLLFIIPIFNVFVFLPLAILLSIKQLKFISHDSKTNGALPLTVYVLIMSCISEVASIVGLIYSIYA